MEPYIHQNSISKGEEIINETIIVHLGYDNVFVTGQLTKYCIKWRKRSKPNKKRQDFHVCFTEYDKEPQNNTTDNAGLYSMSQVQKIVQGGIQSEIVA